MTRELTRDEIDELCMFVDDGLDFQLIAEMFHMTKRDIWHVLDKELITGRGSRKQSLRKTDNSRYAKVRKQADGRWRVTFSDYTFDVTADDFHKAITNADYFARLFTKEFAA